MYTQIAILKFYCQKRLIFFPWNLKYSLIIVKNNNNFFQLNYYNHKLESHNHEIYKIFPQYQVQKVQQIYH